VTAREVWRSPDDPIAAPVVVSVDESGFIVIVDESTGGLVVVTIGELQGIVGALGDAIVGAPQRWALAARLGPMRLPNGTQQKVNQVVDELLAVLREAGAA
jgi:hypothetical protein